MPRRVVGQLGFGEAGLSRREGRGVDALQEISRLVDWSRIDGVLSSIHTSTKGEAAYPPLVMFKVLLLQRWHGLSDPAMESALSDRLSFLRFAGLSLEDETPDHSTIWRFRNKLTQDGLIERLFAEVVEQLSRNRVLVKEGTMIDATLLTSAARRPGHQEPKESKTDPDARFGTSNERGRFEFGYKFHAAVDVGSDLVRAVAVTPANVQEVTIADALIPEDAGTVYADRGYHSKRLRDFLVDRKLGDAIMRRGDRRQPLSEAEQQKNHAITAVRSNIERLFGHLKRSYRLGRLRAFSLARNNVDLHLYAIAFNLRRWRRLATP